MTVQQLVDKLNLTVFSGKKGLQRTITGGYVSDLLSDVMGYANEGDIWVTLQSHKNVMAIASLKDISAVILVKGILPENDTIIQSNEEEIPVLGTFDQCFEISGKLYNLIADNK